MDEQCVQIEVGDGLSRPVQLDVTKRALRRRPAAGKQRINQRTERTDRISARTPRLPGDINLNRPNPPQIDRKVEIAVDPGDRRTHMLIERRERQPGHMHFSNLRKVNVPRPVHAQIPAIVDLAPHANPQLVVRTDHVGGSGRGEITGRKCGWNVAKQADAIDGKQLSRCGRHELLELGGQIRGQFLPRLPNGIPPAKCCVLRRRRCPSFAGSKASRWGHIALGLLLVLPAYPVDARTPIRAQRGRALLSIVRSIPGRTLSMKYRG